MRNRHPEWSERQIECCLYWQGTARKQLREKIKIFSIEKPEYKILTCPEACGVNVTATVKKLGIVLEWSPKKWVYQVAFSWNRALT